MKKFIIKAGIIGLLPFIILLIAYLVVPVKENHYMRAYCDKCNLLEEVPTPRIIFVGGSNVGFGLDSKRIKDSLNINVINYGLHAGIGLKYMIDDVSLYCRPGDILVFAPEWDHFYNIMNGVGESLSIIMKLNKFSKLQLMNYSQKVTVLKGIPICLQQNIYHQNITEKTYLVSNYNEFGDEEKHWSLENNFKSNPQPFTSKFDTDFGKYFIDKLKELQLKCTVVMIPPACCDVAMKKWNKQVKEVEEFLKDNGQPFIVNPDSCSFAEEYMYDTNYHLNKKGVDIRTSIVIEALKQVLSEKNDVFY